MQNTKNITFKDEDTLSLINHLINIYIAKYPISGYISKDPTLHLANVEKHLNKKQLSIIKYPYQTDRPLGITLNCSNNDKIIINIIVDPTTGIVNKESLYFLSSILSDLKDDITIIELYNYLLNSNIPNISIDSLKTYIMECQRRLDLRDIIIEYVIKSLIESDMNIANNGIYRSEMFAREINTCYHIPNKLALSKR